MSSGRWTNRAATGDDVQLLHPQTDAEGRNSGLLHELAEQAVGDLAALGQQRHRGVKRHAQLARVEIVASGQDDAIELLEDRQKLTLPDEGRNHDRQGVGGQQAIVVAAGGEAARDLGLREEAKVGVDTDERTVSHGRRPFLEQGSAKSIR